MPVLVSSYSPPLALRSGHLQTVLPTLFRQPPAPPYQRERIDTADGDFLDLDWARVGADKLGIICHGLEGNSGRPYVTGMARALNSQGWDALAWNYRGCGGEPNRALRLYHSGATDDLGEVVNHALAQGRYRQAALIGFSLGGNLLLKYLGELGQDAPDAISHGVAFSAPCDLASSARQMDRPVNRLYIKRFLRLLRQKIRAKMEIMPGALSDEGYESIKNFHDFDNRYTAPINGFKDADDYYARASSRPWLGRLSVPCLLVNALDDPLLGAGCFPWREARENPLLFLEAPAHGGHVGFMGPEGIYWSERRALKFLASAPPENAKP